MTDLLSTDDVVAWAKAEVARHGMNLVEPGIKFMQGIDEDDQPVAWWEMRVRDGLGGCVFIQFDADLVVDEELIRNEVANACAELKRAA